MTRTARQWGTRAGLVCDWANVERAKLPPLPPPPPQPGR